MTFSLGSRSAAAVSEYYKRVLRVLSGLSVACTFSLRMARFGQVPARAIAWSAWGRMLFLWGRGLHCGIVFRNTGGCRSYRQPPWVCLPSACRERTFGTRPQLDSIHVGQGAVSSKGHPPCRTGSRTGCIAHIGAMPCLWVSMAMPLRHRAGGHTSSAIALPCLAMP